MTIKNQLGPGFLPSTARVPKSEQRLDRLGLYMAIAHLFASRSTCVRGRVGCVAVRDNRLVAAGYNGAPSGFPHCTDVGCGGGVVTRPAQLDPLPNGEMPRPAEMQDTVEFPKGCTRAIHAEANLVFYAAKAGLSLEDCTVYSTCGPCLPCAHALVSAGVVIVHYEHPYRLRDGVDFLIEAGVVVHRHGN